MDKGEPLKLRDKGHNTSDTYNKPYVATVDGEDIKKLWYLHNKNYYNPDSGVAITLIYFSSIY